MTESYLSRWPYLFIFLPAAYGNSQARGQNQSFSCPPQPQPLRIQAVSVTSAMAHGNAGSPTQWSEPGIEPTSSEVLVGFVTAELWWEFQMTFICWALSPAGLPSTSSGVDSPARPMNILLPWVTHVSSSSLTSLGDVTGTIWGKGNNTIQKWFTR